MAGLQRSTISFRRQGSSGLVWDDPVLSGDVNQKKQKEEGTEFRESRTSRSVEHNQRGGGGGGGGRGYRTDRMVSPSMDPPSPKMSSCGCCSAFRKPENAKRRGFP